MPSQTERGKFLYAGGLERNTDIMKIGKSVNVHVYISHSILNGNITFDIIHTAGNSLREKTV